MTETPLTNYVRQYQVAVQIESERVIEIKTNKQHNPTYFSLNVLLQYKVQHISLIRSDIYWVYGILIM